VRRLFRRLPLFKLIAVGEVALLARKHLQKLPPADRRRLAELVRRGHRLSPAEREELRGLLSKLEPGAFAGSALDRFSPIPLPRRFTRGRR
jgi:hypothetical protein